MLFNPRFITCALALAMASSASNTANAAINLTASFLEPTATVAADQPIEIWLRISAQPDSDPFYYDPTQSPAFQIPAEYLPTSGLTGNDNETKPFATYDDMTRAAFGRCLSSPLYCFAPTEMYTQQSVWLNGTTGLNIAPGETKDVLYAVFEPVAGAVVAGTYVLDGAGIGLTAYGKASDGTPLAANVIFSFACMEGSDCNFTRTVTAVPEPSSNALMLLGLLAAVTIKRVKGKA